MASAFEVILQGGEIRPPHGVGRDDFTVDDDLARRQPSNVRSYCWKAHSPIEAQPGVERGAPVTLSADSHNDLADYLAIFLRKAKRRAQARSDDETAN
jgi:hypothetical protein